MKTQTQWVEEHQRLRNALADLVGIEQANLKETRDLIMSGLLPIPDKEKVSMVNAIDALIDIPV